MKLTEKDLQEIVEAMEMAKELKPLVKNVAGMLMDYGAELKPTLQAACDHLVDSRVRSIKRYQEAGFSRHDAITLTLDQSFAIKRIIRDTEKRTPKK